MQKLNIKKCDVVMIGDTLYDAKGAATAGVDFVAVTYGYGFRSANDAKQANPVFVVDNLQDLIGWFQNK
jgi:phosphoglycolate phosphatase